MKYLDDVNANIKKGKSVIFYKQDVYPYYKKLKNSFKCVYISEPGPVRTKLFKVQKNIANEKLKNANQKSISDLKELIIKGLKHETLVIMFNHFERLTRKALEAYEYLNSFKNIAFIASFTGKFHNDVYSFFKKFKFINSEEYEHFNKKDEINVTYALYFILGAICFAMYLKFALSLCTGTIFFSTIIMGAVWFSFMIFRTLLYTGGRV